MSKKKEIKDIIKVSKMYTYEKQVKLYYRIKPHIRLFNVRFEAVDDIGLTLIADTSVGTVNSSMIEALGNDVYVNDNMRLIAWDFYSKDYLDTEKHTISLYLRCIGEKGIRYKNLNRKRKALLHAFFIMRFARLPKNDWGYFLDWAKRFKLHSEYNYADGTSRFVLNKLDRIKEHVKSEEGRW